MQIRRGDNAANVQWEDAEMLMGNCSVPRNFFGKTCSCSSLALGIPDYPDMGHGYNESIHLGRHRGQLRLALQLPISPASDPPTVCAQLLAQLPQHSDETRDW